MATAVPFDTLRFARKLETAEALAEALATTDLVTRDYLDAKLADLKAKTMKWMIGALGLQTLAILGGVVALIKLIRH